MKFVAREGWGAPAQSAAAYQGSVRGVKVHYLGSPYSSRPHGECDDMVRKIRAEHLANKAEGYSDIAYNALVCEHGHVFEGRGAHKRTGANGNGELNRQDYAVCALLGSKGLTEPSDAMLHGIRDAIEWLRKSGGAGDWIGGHRDGYATACPGGPLYAWVKKGAPRPGGKPAPEKPAPGKPAGGKPAGQAPPFPGANAFRVGRRHVAVTALDRQLIRLGFVKHCEGREYTAGPLFTEYTRLNVADFQRSRRELSADPDGTPGPLTWTLLHTLPG